MKVVCRSYRIGCDCVFCVAVRKADDKRAERSTERAQRKRERFLNRREVKKLARSEHEYAHERAFAFAIDMGGEA